VSRPDGGEEERMKYRFKENANVNVPGKHWITRDTVFDGDWTPAWPPNPRLVRLFSPSDPNDFLDLPVTMLKEVEQDSRSSARRRGVTHTIGR
jgi:hypothetical protein